MVEILCSDTRGFKVLLVFLQIIKPLPRIVVLTTCYSYYQQMTRLLISEGALSLFSLTVRKRARTHENGNWLLQRTRAVASPLHKRDIRCYQNADSRCNAEDGERNVAQK